MGGDHTMFDVFRKYANTVKEDGCFEMDYDFDSSLNHCYIRNLCVGQPFDWNAAADSNIAIAMN